VGQGAGRRRHCPLMSATYFGASRRAARQTRALLGDCACSWVSRGFFSPRTFTRPRGADIKSNVCATRGCREPRKWKPTATPTAEALAALQDSSQPEKL
jgi:hypothetical protein